MAKKKVPRLKSDARAFLCKLLDNWLPIKIQYEELPGISVGVGERGKLFYSRGFGYADLERGDQMTGKTLFHVASISKMFTAVAVMKLVEEGKFHLDQRVAAFLPWFMGRTKKGNLENITLRQLLSHSSGLFRDGNTAHWQTGQFPGELKSALSPSSLVFENLTQFRYSNYAFSLLGSVIEKVSGLSYEDYIKKNVIDALGLKNSFPDYKEGIKNIAKGYGRVIPGELRDAFGKEKTRAYAPATGLISNVPDLTKFLGSLLLNTSPKLSLISRESKKELFRPQEQAGGDEEWYGLGFEVLKIKGRKIVGHSGGFSGYVTQAVIDLDSGLSVVVLINSLGGPAFWISKGIMEIIFMLQDRRAELFEGKRKIIPSKYEGLYRNRWNDEVVVGTDYKLVNFSADTSMPSRAMSVLRPKSSSKFEVEERDHFAESGELAQFKDLKDKKFQEFMFGASPLKRVR